MEYREVLLERLQVFQDEFEFDDREVARLLVCPINEVIGFKSGCGEVPDKTWLMRLDKVMKREASLDPAVRSMRFLRRRGGWSQGELAAYIGCARVTLSKLEKHETEYPSLGIARNAYVFFYEEFGVSIGAFFGGDIRQLKREIEQ